MKKLMNPPISQANHAAVDARWLALHDEPVLDPDRRIIDPHHHLWDRKGMEYEADELLADLYCGHDIRATVFVQCRTHYRDHDPPLLRPVGETEYVARLAADIDQAHPQLQACKGIICHADLTAGDQLEAVLKAHIEAGRGRVKGVRHSTAWDADPEVFNPELGGGPHMLREESFRTGVARLAEWGLTYDAWVYHPQIPEVAALARACPQAIIVLNHAGGPVGIGKYAASPRAVFEEWLHSMRELASCPNVSVKLGGLAMRISGTTFHQQATPPGSEALAERWAPYVHACIEAFGPQRCMFESNFPVDKASCSYAVLWNAFKRLAARYSEEDQDALFFGTAQRVYALAIE